MAKRYVYALIGLITISLLQIGCIGRYGYLPRSHQRVEMAKSFSVWDDAQHGTGDMAAKDIQFLVVDSSDVRHMVPTLQIYSAPRGHVKRPTNPVLILPDSSVLVDSTQVATTQTKPPTQSHPAAWAFGVFAALNLLMLIIQPATYMTFIFVAMFVLAALIYSIQLMVLEMRKVSLPMRSSRIDRTNYERYDYFRRRGFLALSISIGALLMVFLTINSFILPAIFAVISFVMALIGGIYLLIAWVIYLM